MPQQKLVSHKCQNLTPHPLVNFVFFSKLLDLIKTPCLKNTIPQHPIAEYGSFLQNLGRTSTFCKWKCTWKVPRWIPEGMDFCPRNIVTPFFFRTFIGSARLLKFSQTPLGAHKKISIMNSGAQMVYSAIIGPLQNRFSIFLTPVY